MAISNARKSLGVNEMKEILKIRKNNFKDFVTVDELKKTVTREILDLFIFGNNINLLAEKMNEDAKKIKTYKYYLCSDIDNLYQKCLEIYRKDCEKIEPTLKKLETKNSLNTIKTDEIVEILGNYRDISRFQRYTGINRGYFYSQFIHSIYLEMSCSFEKLIEICDYFEENYCKKINNINYIVKIIEEQEKK